MVLCQSAAGDGQGYGFVCASIYYCLQWLGSNRSTAATVDSTTHHTPHPHTAAVPEELPEALAWIPWPWGYLAIALVLLAGLLTSLQKRYKLLSDVRLGLVFLSVIVDQHTGRPKTFVNCFSVRTVLRVPFRSTQAGGPLLNGHLYQSNQPQRAVRRWPNKVAIHFVDDGRKLTFQEIDLQANKVAHLLAKHVRLLLT